MSNPISEQQKKVWNKYAPGWDKWDNLTMDISRPAGDVMIHSLYLKGDENILDLACGTGEQGLAMARMLKKAKGNRH